MIQVAKQSCSNKTRKKKNNGHSGQKNSLENEPVKHVNTNYMDIDDILKNNKDPKEAGKYNNE